jgi:AsmA-like protein
MSPANLPANPSAGKSSKPPRTARIARAARISCWTVLVLIGVYAVVLAIFWPFTQHKIAQRLSEETSSDVRFHDFKATFSPPGCVVLDVEVRPLNEPASPPVVTIKRLTVTTNYRELWRQRVETMRLEDVRVDVPRSRGTAAGAGTNTTQSYRGTFTSIAELIIERAVLEYPRNDKPPLVFPIHRLTLDDVVRDKPISFHVDMDNALPPGHIQGDGQFNPWKVAKVADTLVSGEYTFSDARLDSLPGIGGALSSQGTFGGPAKALGVQGTTDTPEFRVKSAAHPVHLRTDFQAVVNCSNGDVTLRSVRAQFRGTGASFRGDIKRPKGATSRVASLQVDGTDGRIEDLLWLLSEEREPAMMGPISMHARVAIPGGKQQFIARVRLQGEFKIDGATFTKPDTQAKVNTLSFRAVGQKVPKSAADLPDPRASLQGQVDLLDGVAHFSQLSFSLPGAIAHMQGAYNLNDERVNLQGELVVDKKFSKTANNLPSRVITWAGEKLFAKSTGAGEILPVKLTGTYDHPSFGIQK